jgi:hypothetical protein
VEEISVKLLNQGQSWVSNERSEEIAARRAVLLSDVMERLCVVLVLKERMLLQMQTFQAKR